MNGEPRSATYDWEILPKTRLRLAEVVEFNEEELQLLANQEVWRTPDSTKKAVSDQEPLSIDWFQHLSHRRFRKHGRWIPKIFGFTRHADEAILAIGDGMGCEWRALADGGARVCVIEPSRWRCEIYRKHFDLLPRESIQVVQSRWDQLPSGDAQVDVMCGFFHQPPDIKLIPLAQEIYRVLRPGGKVVLALPAHYDCEWYQNGLIPWRWGRKKVVQGYRNSDLEAAFQSFEGIHLKKRHLRRSQLPYLWRWLPLPISERIMGQFVIIKAYKPLSASTGLRIAA